MRGRAAALAACALALVLTPGATARAERATPTQVWRLKAMHTQFSLALPASAAARAPTLEAKLARQLEAIVARVEHVANEWRPGTPLAQVNAGAGGWVRAPAELRALLRLSLAVARQSDGAFDPSWAALRGLWRFPPRGGSAAAVASSRAGVAVPGASSEDGGGAARQVPDAALCRQRAAFVDHRAIDIDDAQGRVRLRRVGMALGLGGVAKGWTLDRLRERLEAAGLRAYALDAGGQLLVRGGLGTAQPYRVGVRDPRAEDPEAALALLEVQDGSVSTSADYERFFEVGGVRYHHLLDPRDGQPARALRSATVVVALQEPNAAARADALSTAIFVAGPQRGADLCASLAPAGGCVLVDAAGALHVSPALRPRLHAGPNLVLHLLPVRGGPGASP